MNPAIDTRQHLKAVRSLLDAKFVALGSEARAYEPDDLPGANRDGGDLPPLFALVTTQRGAVNFRRLSAQSGRTSWRLRIFCGGTTVDEAEWVKFRVAEALDEVTLPIPGSRASTRLKHENSNAPVFDDGRYSSSTVYTYTV